MPWKAEYLANLLRIAAADNTVGNKEFLAVLEIEKRIRAKIDDYLKGSSAAEKSEDLSIDDSPFLVRSQLRDMYIIAMLEEELSRAEEDLIESYISSAGIPKQMAEDIRDAAASQVDDIIKDMLETKPQA